MLNNVYHIYPYYTTQRTELINRLRTAEVSVMRHYPTPLHLQDCFGTMFKGLDYPEAERIAEQEVSLPISPTMSEEDAHYVIDAIDGKTNGKRQVPFLDLGKVNAQYAEELMGALTRVVDSGWFINGKECSAFEQEFAAYCADKSGVMSLNCVGCGNGLDALTLILLALKQQHGWTKDCEVIVPAMTFVATGQAVIKAGLTLRLCDVDENGLMDPMSVAWNITNSTVAIIPVHLYGQHVDMDTLCELADLHQLEVIQDAAQGHGLSIDTPNGKIMAAFSFYPGKNLGALGDGGAIVTNDTALATHVRALGNYGSREKYHHDYEESINSRLDEIQAAILRVKLRHLDEDNAARQKIAEIYDAALK